MENKLNFEIICDGAVKEWHRAAAEQASLNFSSSAVIASEELKNNVESALQRANKGYVYRSIVAAIKSTQRYAYIKRIKDNDGGMHDAEVDLLALTISFEQIHDVYTVECKAEGEWCDICKVDTLTEALAEIDHQRTIEDDGTVEYRIIDLNGNVI